MQKPQIACRINMAFLCGLVVATFALIAPKALAQTVTINPPQYPNLSLPFPDLYLNAAVNWQYQKALANSAPNATFLPSTPLTRVVGNVHWINIQPGYDRTKPMTDPDVNQPTWSNTLASLGTNTGTGCTPTSSYWWQAAQCYPSKGNTASNPNNIIYTFYTVPLWASAANGTHLSATYANTYDGWTVSSASTSNGLVTMYVNGDANIELGDSVVINGNNYNKNLAPPYGPITVGVTNTPTVNNNLTEIQFYMASGYTKNPDNTGYVTFTNTHPPYDVYYSGTTCNLPDGSVSPTKGDCFFKSYVTYMMMHTCGNQNLTTKPSSPLSTCVIHYWEGWNEFNANGFWSGHYGMLAKMMVDADAIIHDYCSDCYFLAGSTAASNDNGGHFMNPADREGNNTASDNSNVYLEALGELLRDWVNVARQLPTTYHKNIKPDAVSFHPYWGDDRLSPPTMPETNVNPNWDPSVSGYGNVQKCTGTQDITDENGNSVPFATPAGCVNACGRQYSYNATTGVTSYTTINLNPNFPCTSYLANPQDSQYGNAWPGCGTERTTPTAYGTRSQWVEPTNNPPADFLTQKPPVAFEPIQMCRDSFVNSIKAVQQLLPAISADPEVTQYVGPNWLIGLPIWNTESSWAKFGDTAFTGQNALTTYTDSKDHSLSTLIQQAYIARMSILAAQAGTAVNLWYQWDEDVKNPNPDCTPWFSNWGKLGYDFPKNYNKNYAPGFANVACPISDTNDTNGPKVERAGYTFNRVFEWLQGMHFTNSCSTADGTTWTCSIANNSGYAGVLVWYTPFDKDAMYTVPSGMICQKDIDGNMKPVSPGSQHDTNNRPALYDNTAAASCTGLDPWPK